MEYLIRRQYRVLICKSSTFLTCIGGIIYSVILQVNIRSWRTMASSLRKYSLSSYVFFYYSTDWGIIHTKIWHVLQQLEYCRFWHGGAALQLTSRTPIVHMNQRGQHERRFRYWWRRIVCFIADHSQQLALAEYIELFDWSFRLSLFSLSLDAAVVFITSLTDSIAVAVDCGSGKQEKLGGDISLLAPPIKTSLRCNCSLCSLPHHHQGCIASARPKLLTSPSWNLNPQETRDAPRPSHSGVPLPGRMKTPAITLWGS